MNAEPHILHVRSSAGLYGAEHVILGLLPELQRLGIASTLLCVDNQYLDEQPLWSKAQALGLPCARLPCRGRFDFATVGALRRMLDQTPHALVHVHDYKSALIAWLARGRRAVPIVATSHGQFSSSASLHFYHRLELSLMRRFDRVCIVSADMRPLLRRARVSDARIVLLENGIDTRRFAPDVPALARTSLGIPDDAFVFGAAMRLAEQKNPLGLVEAFAALARERADAHLAIAGDGPLHDALVARAFEFGCSDRVHMLGARDDLERYYRVLDVFVLPSHYEGLPLALLEAMAAQCRIVATAVGQVPQVLEGLGCEVVPASDNAALTCAMRAAMSSPPANAAVRQCVIDRYSVQRMAGEYATLYRDVWSGHARAAA